MWNLSWRNGGAPQIALSALVMLPIQAFIAGVFYLLGVGLGPTDFITVALLLAVGAAISAVVIRMEGVVLGNWHHAHVGRPAHR